MDIRDKSGNNYQSRQPGQKARAPKGRGLDLEGDQVRAKGKRWGRLVRVKGGKALPLIGRD